MFGRCIPTSCLDMLISSCTHMANMFLVGARLPSVGRAFCNQPKFHPRSALLFFQTHRKLSFNKPLANTTQLYLCVLALMAPLDLSQPATLALPGNARGCIWDLFHADHVSLYWETAPPFELEMPVPIEPKGWFIFRRQKGGRINQLETITDSCLLHCRTAASQHRTAIFNLCLVQGWASCSQH